MKKKFQNFFKERILGEQVREVDKEKSAITLLVWIVFILIVFAFVKINYNSRSNENKNNDNVIKEVNNDEILYNSFNKLKDYYNYSITINDNENNNTLYYTGSYANNVNTGKKTMQDSVINYRIDALGIFNSETNEVIDNLYDSYLVYFFNPNNVYSYVKDIDVKEIKDDKTKVFTYNNIYNDNNIDIKIVIKDDNIIEIDYSYLNIDYKILFS